MIEAHLRAVLDTNVAIGLAKGGVLPLLPRLFRYISLPSVAVAEVLDAVSQQAVRSALSDWLVIREPGASALLKADRYCRGTDRCILALAMESAPCTLLTGDRALASRAQSQGIPTLDAPHLVEALARLGLIADAQAVLDTMVGAGFGVDAVLYDSILRSLKPAVEQ